MPFQKGQANPGFKKGHKGTGGRPKKSVVWKVAEDALREALPRILLMRKNDLQRLLQSNPSGAEMLAAKYLHEHVPQAVDKFLGKTPSVLIGQRGKPPITVQPPLPSISFTDWTAEQIDRFIDITAYPKN